MASKLKLLGAYGSTCTRTVLATLEETGTEFDFQAVNFMVGEHKSADYLAKQQPFGQIPVLWDGDFRLFESRAIAKYVIEKSGKDALYPTDLKKRALVEQWLSVGQSNLGPITAIVSEFIFGPKFFGKAADESKIPALTEGLNKFSDILEAQLKTTKYLAGDEFTLADLSFLSYIQYMVSLPSFATPFEGHPHVKAWWLACSTRPAWQKTASRFQ